jgi:carbonic anhydrase
MRLFEAIVDANHRALAGDSRAGLRPSEYAEGLPIVALTCIDPRLNPIFPEVLGIREEDFIWLRNAGNILFDSMGSMLRTLALACAIKGGKEIAIIGHTDCRVRQVSVSQLIESFRALGIERARLPDNLVEFFGLFASERQNVINAVHHARRSPLISAKVPVHGLLVDIETGRLEWLVNGYDELGQAASLAPPLLQKLERAKDVAVEIGRVVSGNTKLPQVKIGEWTLDPQRWLSEIQVLSHSVQGHLHPDPVKTAADQAPALPETPPKLPPRIGPKSLRSN